MASFLCLTSWCPNCSSLLRVDWKNEKSKNLHRSNRVWGLGLDPSDVIEDARSLRKTARSVYSKYTYPDDNFAPMMCEAKGSDTFILSNRIRVRISAGSDSKTERVLDLFFAAEGIFRVPDLDFLKLSGRASAQSMSVFLRLPRTRNGVLSIAVNHTEPKYRNRKHIFRITEVVAFWFVLGVKVAQLLRLLLLLRLTPVLKMSFSWYAAIIVVTLPYWTALRLLSFICTSSAN